MTTQDYCVIRILSLTDDEIISLSVNCKYRPIQATEQNLGVEPTNQPREGGREGVITLRVITYSKGVVLVELMKLVLNVIIIMIIWHYYDNLA